MNETIHFNTTDICLYRSDPICILDKMRHYIIIKLIHNNLDIDNIVESFKCMCVCACSHREPATDISDEDEGVVVEVAHHGVAAAQLSGTPVSFVVVTNASVPHHGQHKGEDPLVEGVKKERRYRIVRDRIRATGKRCSIHNSTILLVIVA